ncbi:thiol peroxidase [Mucisphaera calidilacus]
MTERAAAVTLKGNPMTLLGDELSVGDTAPAFSLVANDMSAKTLDDYAGKVKIISVVPSLDTAVCDVETRRFNTEAASLGDNIVILTVSIDTPFAQKRWCGAAGVDKVETLSDFKDHAFGTDYGVRIKEAGILARQVFVLDKNNKIVHAQLVKEVAEEPDYDAILNAAKAAL